MLINPYANNKRRSDFSRTKGIDVLQQALTTVRSEKDKTQLVYYHQWDLEDRLNRISLRPRPVLPSPHLGRHTSARS